MNREQRRNMKRNGGEGELRYLKTPCTIAEAAQIARGVAEDVVTDYANSTSPLQVATSIQVELLKSIVMKAGLVTEEEFKSLYMEQAELLDKMRKEALEGTDDGNGEMEDIETPKMEVSVSDVEVKKV